MGPRSFQEGQAAAENSFLERLCLPFFSHSQNADGGWGGRPGACSAVEPTAWALLALTAAQSSGLKMDGVARGEQWLTKQQLADGSFPAHPGMEEGCWVSAVAAWALHMRGTEPAAVLRAADWLARAVPRGQPFGWRVWRWFSRTPDPVRQNHSLRGWSWTPGTSSWVEPTAYALLFFRKSGFSERSWLGARRVRMADAMLLDRVCPGGGWNCGNPMVYGVAGEPQVLPTAWALLALRPWSTNAALQQSLSWLEGAARATRGPGSAAVAHICLRNYGIVTTNLEPRLWQFYRANQFLDNVSVVSWCALALLPDDWLRQ